MRLYTLLEGLFLIWKINVGLVYAQSSLSLG